MSVGQRHDSDRELFGQGLANLGVPAVRRHPGHRGHRPHRRQRPAGATSRLAALTHAARPARHRAGRRAAGSPRSRWPPWPASCSPPPSRWSGCPASPPCCAPPAATPPSWSSPPPPPSLFDLVTAVLLGLVVAGFFALRQTAKTARLDEVPLDDERPHRRGTLAARRAHRRLPASTARCSSPPPTTSCSSSPRSATCAWSSCGCPASPPSTPPAPTSWPTPSTASKAAASPCCSPGSSPATNGCCASWASTTGLAHERHLFDTTPEAIAHARVHASRIAHTPTDTTG